MILKRKGFFGFKCRRTLIIFKKPLNIHESLKLWVLALKRSSNSRKEGKHVSNNRFPFQAEWWIWCHQRGVKTETESVFKCVWLWSDWWLVRVEKVTAEIETAEEEKDFIKSPWSTLTGSLCLLLSNEWTSVTRRSEWNTSLRFEVWVKRSFNKGKFHQRRQCDFCLPVESQFVRCLFEEFLLMSHSQSRRYSKAPSKRK